MKITFICLACLFSLVFSGGCGDIEDASDSVVSPVSIEDLPADDDIEGAV